MGAGSNNIVTDGLVYCLDAANKRCYSGSGTTGVDLVEGGTATLVNGTAFSSDKVGVFAFDGTDDRIDQDWSFTLGTGDLTIEFWVKMEGWIIHSQGANVFLSVVDPDVHEELQFGIENSTAQRLAVYLDGGSNGSKTGDGVYSWNLNQWYHLVATRISSTVALYRDGVSLTVATGATNTGDVAAISTFLLGNQYKSTQYKHDFQGEMGPIRIYNKGLTAAEVSQNYEATRSRFAPRIAKRGMNLNFDAGDPASYAGGTTTWKDTANGLTTVFHNMDATNFNSSNGGYFAFDGTDDWMSVPYSPLFQGDIADQGTFAAWFNIDEAGDDADPNIGIWGAGRNGGKMTWTMFQYDSDKKIGFGAYLGGSWGSPGITDSALSYDTWYYVVFTWDKANTQVKSYVNGALDDTDTTSSTSITTSTTGWLGIGASLYNTNNGNTPYTFLPGFIGVLQVYNSVLSAAEILDNYNKTKGRFGH